MEHEKESNPPPQTQRLFGTGLKRKRIDFVPASPLSNDPPATPNPLTTNAGARYLSIVLPPSNSLKPDHPSNTSETGSQTVPTTGSPVCEICHLPLDSAAADTSKPHASSLVHQVCLAHSHPPSHLDRRRAGLKYLSAYGWDPDGRVGLGVKGEGIRVPLKAKVKNDTVGLGVERAREKTLLVERREKKSERLDAKGVRKKEVGERKKRERLQEMFYRSEELERYLGPGA